MFTFAMSQQPTDSTPQTVSGSGKRFPAPARQAIHRKRRLRSGALMLGAALTATGSISVPARAQDAAGQAQTPAPAAQPPVPATPTPQTPLPATASGTITLPQGPPPTGLQAPLPPPVTTPENPKRPSQSSPGLRELSIPLSDRPITINDAVAIALATNRSLALSQESLLAAQGRTSEARAAFNPTLGTNFQYTRLAQGQSASIGGQSVSIVNQDQPSFGLSANLPLDIAGSLRAARSQAQFQEVASRLDINRSRNQIVYDVKSAFYQVLRNQALVAVATEQLNNAQARYEDAQRRFIAGVVARFDVTRAQTDVSSAQQQLITSRSNVSDAIAQLNNTIGIDVNTDLAISDRGAVQSPPGVATPGINGSTDTGGTGAVSGLAANGAEVGNGGVAGNASGADSANGANTAGAAPSGTSNTSGSGAAALTTAELPARTTPTLRATALSGRMAQQATTQETPPPGGTEGSAFAGTPVRYDSLNLGPEYDAVLREALETRPDVLEADANIAAARQGITLARRSQLPTLGLALGGVYTPNAAGFSPQTTTGQFGLTVQLPLFDGGVTRARVSEARAAVGQAETNRRTATDTVTLDVRRAYLNLQRTRSNVAVANQGLEEARESYRLARVRYNAGVTSVAGVSPLLEVSDAQAALTQAQSNQVNALYDYNSARAALDRAVGRYSYLGAANSANGTNGANGRNNGRDNGGSGYAAPPGPRILGLATDRQGRVINTTAPGTGRGPNGAGTNGAGGANNPNPGSLNGTPSGGVNGNSGSGNPVGNGGTTGGR